MATVKITPRYGDTYTPCDLNMCVLRRHMRAYHLQVIFMKRKYNEDILIKIADVPPKEFLAVKEINKVPVEISLPPSLNFIVGRIYHPELQYCDIDETMELLETEAFSQVSKRPRGNYVDIYWLITTTKQLPATVLLGWDRVKVHPLKPVPVRCYNCQSYGHVAEDCTKDSVCPTCSGDHEPDTKCQEQPKCPACGGPHTAYDRECPVWLEEKKIAKIKKEEKLSYRDAVKKHQERKQEEKKTEEPRQEEKKTEEPRQEDQEDNSNEEVNIQEEEQVSPTKRKLNQEDNSSNEEQELPTLAQTTPRDDQQDKSGATSDLPGDWHLVNSKKKKK